MTYKKIGNLSFGRTVVFYKSDTYQRRIGEIEDFNQSQCQCQGKKYTQNVNCEFDSEFNLNQLKNNSDKNRKFRLINSITFNLLQKSQSNKQFLQHLMISF